jgi:hypothetical protein
MAYVQTRKSISISGKTYDKLKALSKSTGQSMSGICENLILAELGRAPEPAKQRPEPERRAGNVHTF